MTRDERRQLAKLLLFFAAFIAFGVWLVYALPEGPSILDARR